MRHAFDTAMDEVQRHEAQAPPARVYVGSVCNLVAAVAISPPSPGAHSLWEAAAAWTPEADPPPPRPAPPRPNARPEDIAAELGLAELKTSVDVAQARRRFMWDNHPDRRADLDRELANRRVAIANMLLDRALAVLARRRRGR